MRENSEYCSDIRQVLASFLSFGQLGLRLLSSLRALGKLRKWTMKTLLQSWSQNFNLAGLELRRLAVKHVPKVLPVNLCESSTSKSPYTGLMPLDTMRMVR